VTLDLVHDNYFMILEPCSCRGNPECDCILGEFIAGVLDLGILLANLANAGALTHSYVLGTGWGYRWDGRSTPWRPNTKGRAAPGSEG
jgi:hypothetical protein